MTWEFERLRATLSSVFVDQPPPSRLGWIEPIALLRSGELTSASAAARAKTTATRMAALAAGGSVDAILGGPIPDLTLEQDSKVRATLGQLMIGHLAEQVFEELWSTNLGDQDLIVSDDRSSRGDTDYFVKDGRGRQVFRINIKFHGSQFRRAVDLVGLDPSDCFALATYKIYAALQKQQSEQLPYIFVIVGVPGLTGSEVGEIIPDDLVALSAMAHGMKTLSGKRLVEDAIVDRLAFDPAAFAIGQAVASHLAQIRAATWRVLSARRADMLLREKLFDRAYALRVRGFARNYGGAELDMHFSLSEDLRPLSEFLSELRERGMPGLVTRLERGRL
jgi:hypothetical protein